MRAATRATQHRWIPARFRLDLEFGCITNAERLHRSDSRLKLVVGRTRLGCGRWGDHVWCSTPRGAVIDPYFMNLFPDRWGSVEYVPDQSAFDGNLA